MDQEGIKEKNLLCFSRWAGHYDLKPFQWWMKKFHRPVLEMVSFSRKGKLVDLSCGTGELLKALLKKDKNRMLQLWGVDFTKNMLLQSRKKLPAQVTLLQGDVHNVPLSKNVFDYVVSTEAFHHYYDQKKALQEMVRVAKKKGTVMIVDINFFFPLVHRIFEKLEPGCVHINNKREIRRLFAEAGLESIQQKRTFLFAVATWGTKQ